MKEFSKKKNNRVNNLKIPPQSGDAERSVLGGLLLVKDSWDKVADLIS